VKIPSYSRVRKSRRRPLGWERASVTSACISNRSDRESDPSWLPSLSYDESWHIARSKHADLFEGAAAVSREQFWDRCDALFIKS
jgi:hypothetical protein